MKKLTEKNNKSILDIDFLNQFLFIINSWDSNNFEINDLKDKIDNIKNHLGIKINEEQEIINDEDKNEDEFKLNISYFNFFFVELYANKKELLCNYEYLFNDMIINYQKKPKDKSFIKFFCEELKEILVDTFKIKENYLNEILSKEYYYENIYDQFDDLFQSNIKFTGYIPNDDYNYHKYLKIISSYLTYAEDNITEIDDYTNSNIEKFYYNFEKSINLNAKLKEKYIKYSFRQCIKQFKSLINEKDLTYVLFFKKYFDSFFEILENYDDFDIPNHVKVYKQDLEKLENYYKTLLEVKGYGSGNLYGNWDSNEWSNGICEERKDLNIYKKWYSVYHDKRFIKKAKESLHEYFDDTIVGWKIESCKRDGSNGEWDLSYNPLLKKNFICDFTSQRGKSLDFNVIVYLIKFPKCEFLSKNKYKLGKIDEHEHNLVVTMTNCKWECNECNFKYCKDIPRMYCSICDYNICGDCLQEKGYNKMISFPKDIAFSYKNVKDIIKTSENHEHRLTYCTTMRSPEFNGWRCNVCREVFKSNVWSFYCTCCDFDQCCKCFGIN